MDILKAFENDLVKRIASFVAEDKVTDRIPQPMFIVGSGGSGKSTLLRSVAGAIEDNNIEFEIFDGRMFFGSQDIIRAIEGGDYDIGRNDNGNAETGHRKVALIDDIDYYFKRTSFDDQYVLRSYLNRKEAPLLIATISGIDEALADYRAPFFEGVRLIYIPPFESSLIDKSNASDGIKKRLSRILAYLPPVVRSFQIASEIVTASDNAAMDLKNLIDRHAPVFQTRYDRLPTYSQNILSSLANNEQPSTLADLRERTGLPSGTLSTYLRQLVKSGEIRKAGNEKKGVPYEISDPLFKAWLSSTHFMN